MMVDAVSVETSDWILHVFRKRKQKLLKNWRKDNGRKRRDRHRIEWMDCEPVWGRVQELAAENGEQTSSSIRDLRSWSCEEDSFCF